MEVAARFKLNQFEFAEFGQTEVTARTKRQYLFHQKTDASRVLDSSGYTTRFKAAFERHRYPVGIALICPDDAMYLAQTTRRRLQVC